jgi:hypothetical protein
MRLQSSSLVGALNDGGRLSSSPERNSPSREIAETNSG